MVSDLKWEFLNSYLAITLTRVNIHHNLAGLDSDSGCLVTPGAAGTGGATSFPELDGLEEQQGSEQQPAISFFRSYWLST